MKHMLTFFCAALLWCGVVSAETPEERVTAVFVSDHTQIMPGQTFHVAVRLTMAPGWHTYGQDAGDAGVPTKVLWTLPEGVTAGPLQWPKPETFSFEGITSYGYKDRVDLVTAITVPRQWPVGRELVLDAKVRYLACADICVPGQQDLQLRLPVGETAILSGTTFVPHEEKFPVSLLLAMLALAFAGGLVLNLMPCVLPVISLKILGFVKHAGEDKSVIWKQGLMFVCGIVAAFAVLVGVLLALKAGGAQLGWGFQLQSPIFVWVLVVLFVAVALNLFGLFEVGESWGRFGQWAKQGGAYSESFFSGVLATVVATPCTAPFMGTAVGFALAQPAWVTAVVFLALALGLGSPYLALSFNPKLLRFLPKPVAWMQTFKQLMGFPMLATVVWLLWVLGRQTDVDRMSVVLVTLVLLAFALWAWGKRSPLGTAKHRYGYAAIAVASASAALFWGFQQVSMTPQDDVWQKFDEKAIAAYRQEGKAVFVDFTAAWCLTCQANKKTTLHKPEVLKAFADAHVVLMRADWTNKDAEITKVLERYGRSGVPFYVLYPANPQDKEIFFPTLLTPEIIYRSIRPRGGDVDGEMHARE